MLACHGRAVTSRITVYTFSISVQDYLVTFHLGDGSGKYKLPVHLEGQASVLIDLAQLIAAQRPDAEGHTIPATVQSGSVVVSSAKGEAQSITVALSNAIFNVSTATCVTFCTVCNGISTITVTANPFACPVGGTVQLKATGNWNTGLKTDETPYATWSSNSTAIATVSNTSGSKGKVTGVAPGSCTIKAFENVDTPTSFCGGFNIECPTGNLFGTSPGSVDSLVFTVASNGVPGDSKGVIAKTAFILKIQAKSPTGVVPDTNFNAQNVPLTLINMNSTVGEAVSSSTVNFVNGVTNPTVTIVQASGTTTAPSSIRQIVVSTSATGNIFFPMVYWKVAMNSEFWKNCGFTSCPTLGSYFCQTGCSPFTGLATKTQFMALTDGSACNLGVVVKNGSTTVTTTVKDKGPVLNQPYWFTGSIPTIAGCLSDALEDALGIANGCSPGAFPQSVTIMWRFQQ